MTDPLNEAFEALKKYRNMREPLGQAFFSVGPDTMLRRDSFWRHFDELLTEISKLAEGKYELWKKNPNHPSPHFK